MNQALSLNMASVLCPQLRLMTRLSISTSSSKGIEVESCPVAID